MSSFSSPLRWYVASTHRGAEDRAEQHIIRQGFRCFVPRQIRTVRHARRQIEKRSAFFPGYLFVAFDLMRDRWRSLNGTMGVRSLVTQADRPVCCPPGLVEHFLDLTDDDGVLNFEPSFTLGQSVRVVRGPFSSLSGRLVQLSSNGRVQILLEIMNGNINVTMGMRDIVPGAMEAAE
jgi:transcription antitermination factor NusG